MEARKPTDATPYELIPFIPVEGKDIVKREDPKLFKVEQLRMVGVLGSMSVKIVNPKHPLTDLENAEAPKVEVKKEKPKKEKPLPGGRPGENFSSGAEGGDLSMGGGESSDMMSGGLGGMQMGGPGWRMPMLFDRGYRGGFAGANSGGYGSESGYGSGSDSSSMSSESSGVSGTSGMSGMSGGYTPMAAPVVQGTPTPVNAWFIAGSAVVPHRKFVEEYERVLKESKDYKATRDMPKYVSFQVSRADVTAKPVEQLQEADWVVLNSLSFENQERNISKWETNQGAMDPVAKPFKLTYFDGRPTSTAGLSSMTLPIPPLYIEDYSSIAYHPAIPKTLDSLMPKVEAPVVQEEQLPENLPVGPILPGSQNMNQQPVPMVAAPTQLTPEFQLIRFYDFFDPKNVKESPMPNRKYVYRVRLMLEDPNYPALPADEPHPRYLTQETFARIEKLKVADKASGGRSWYRTTEWSDPSDPVSLPGQPNLAAAPVIDLQSNAKTYASIGSWYYGGAVSQHTARAFTVGNRRMEFEMKPPIGKLVAVQWSNKYTTWVPTLMDVTRGSVLNHFAETNVVDPQSLVIKKLPPKEFAVATNAVALDFAGGDKLGASTPDSELFAPGIILIYDEKGGLKVLDEASDSFGYRKYTYADEAPKP